jgi:hypothetical protein
MKRMLIVGNEYPGIKSVSWPEVNFINITDYQVLIIDLISDCPLTKDERVRFTNQISSLLKYGYPVIYLLPRVSLGYPDTHILPDHSMRIKSKSGQTLNYIEDDIINFYKKFITQHEIIIQGYEVLYDYNGIKLMAYPLITNNIKETCSLKMGDTYLLHPPDKKFHKKAIKSLVDYFSPDFEEESEEKPEWASQYELRDLGLQEKENEINEIDRRIEELSKAKEEKTNEKAKIAKWSDLITRQGKTLEVCLKEAFELLGVEKVEHEPDGTHGQDLRIEHKNMGFTIEVEGSKGPIRIDKARELLHWMADAPLEHKGILIGNPFRELDPKERPPQNNKLFVKEAIDLAKKRELVLITSNDIFKLVCKKLRGEKIDINEILAKIFNSKGELNI